MPGPPCPICLWLGWACASVCHAFLGTYPIPYPNPGVNLGAGIAGVHPIPGIDGGGVCCAGCADGASCAALAACAACSSCSLLREFLREIELLRPPSLSMMVKVSDGELYRARSRLGN